MLLFLSRMTHIGIRKNMPPNMGRNIMLINGLSLIAIGTALLSTLVSVWEMDAAQLGFAASLIMSFVGVIYLNFRGLNVVSVHIFLWVAVLGIGLACIINDYQTYMFLYLMPVSLIPIMTFKKYRCRYVYFTLAILVLIFIKVYHQNYEPLIRQSENFTLTQQYMSLILSNLCNFYLVVFFKKTNAAYEQSLEKGHFYMNDLLIKTQHNNHELQTLNHKLQESEEELRQKATHLAQANDQLENTQKSLQDTLRNLKDAQAQLVQSEKMVSLGQLTAGIAHELNNPINFVYAGTNALEISIIDIKTLLEAYETLTPENAVDKLAEIQELKQDLEIEETQTELSEMLCNIKNGAKRTAEIVKGLQTFSRLDENDIKAVDLHENIDSTLIILRNQYKDRIQVERNYGKIPPVECLPGKINQVFMNILANAVQAIKDKGEICISTSTYQHEYRSVEYVKIAIKDSGTGIPKPIQHKIFDPFFTTKDVGEGTGLGLSISHGIIQKHHGMIELFTEVGIGTEFVIHLPVYQMDTREVLAQ